MASRNWGRVGALALALGWLTVGCGSEVDTTPSGDGGSTSVGGAPATGGGGAGGNDGPDLCVDVAARLRPVLATAYPDDLAGGLYIGASQGACRGWVGVTDETTMMTDDVVNTGSFSEMLVMAAIMREVDMGALTLDDPLDMWVTSNITTASQITLRMLLNHTSGLPNHFSNQDLLAALQTPGQTFTPQQLVQYAAEQPLQGMPGEAFASEFINTILLGLVLESVTGQTAPAAIRDLVLMPLGITDLGLGGDEIPVDALSPGYSELGVDVSRRIHPSAWWVSASYYGTAQDVVAATDGILRGDLLSSASRAALVEMTIPTNFPGESHGLGVLEDASTGLTMVGQAGTLPGFEVRAFHAPSIDTVVVIVANNEGAPTFSPLVDTFAALLAAN